MKYLLKILFLALTLSLYNCNGQQSVKTSLTATEFSDKIKTMPDAALIDARTPAEFSKGHLPNALNVNWNGGDFDKQVASLDKSKPVLIYCLSGARSAAAANKMRADGFKQVLELEGGIMKWRAANLPESTDNTPQSAGMTKQDFDKLVVSDKAVLVDFYADWCAPCKQMKPYLDEISKDMADKVVVVRINADDNQALCKELKIDALPVLQVYKSGKQTWNNLGFIDKAGVLKQL